MHILTDAFVAARIVQRARFGSIALWLTLLVSTAVFMASQFSGRQPASVALDVGLSIIRIGLPILIILIAQELLCNEFLRRNYLFSITYPRTRQNFLMGRVLAIALIIFILLFFLATLLAGLVTLIAENYEQSTPIAIDHRFATVIAFIGLDLLVMLAISTLLSVAASTPSFVLIGSLGFMVVARSYSPIAALLTRDSSLVGDADTYQSSLNLLGYLLPDLAALDVRMIALYGQWQFLPEDWLMRVTATLAYVVGLLGLAVWALNRKKFA